MNPPPKTEPTRRRRPWRRLALVAAGGVLVVAGVALPWWLPAAIARVAGAYGVTIGSWQSHGWGGTEYRDVVFTQPGLRVQVDSVELPLFLIYPRGVSNSTAQARIEIHQVSVGVTERPDRPETPPADVGPIVARIDQAWSILQRWLPPARIDEVDLVASGETFVLESVLWDGLSFQGTMRAPARGLEGVASIVRSDPGTFVVHARVPAREASVDLTLIAEGDGGASARGGVVWRGTPADLQARFGPVGVVPETASIVAEAVTVPAADIGLVGYGPARGALRVQWSRDAYTLNVTARAEPLPGSEWPVLAVDVRASGDMERLRVEAIDIDLPKWRAALSQPLEYTFGRGLAGEPATFSVEGELAAVPVLEARGRIQGSARVHPAGDGSAEVEFSLKGSDLGWRAVDGAKLALTGRWRRPELAVDSAVIEIGAEAHSEVSLTIDTATRIVREAKVRAVLPAVLLRAISAEVPPCERIELNATAEGPWARLKHRGDLTVAGLEWTPGRLVGGKAGWSGEGPSAVIEGELGLAGGGTLPFAFRGAREADGSIDGTIERLLWTDADGEWWHLAEPVAVRYESATRHFRLAPWRIQGDGIELAGEAQVRWPALGDVSLIVTGLEGRRFGGVLPAAIRGGRIERLSLRARWDHGPAEIAGSVRAIYVPVEGTTYAIEGEFATGEQELAFGPVQVLDASGVVLRGVGRLPLVVEGTEAGFRAELRRDGPLALELDSEPNPVFWKSIADLTGWTVEDPLLTCRLGGSLAAPRGEAQFSAATLRPPALKLAGGGQLPEFTGLQLKVAADDAGLSITESMVAIDDRWITLTGHAPWDVWSRWRKEGSIEWRRASFELASNPLPIEIASRVFPTALSPVGEVSIKVAHQPGEGFSGRLWLHGAALRPIGPLGSIRELQCELDLDGYVAKLTTLEGLLGGQPMKVTGEADFAEPGQTAFGLHVTSSRVPLVRRAGLIIRTELDLELKKVPGSPARVTGRIDFGPSLFSADLLELVPGGVDRPESRPPYFSVEEKPFADWQLDIAAHGEGFMRLTTPFYKDLLSTDVRLTGTLAEPRVEGWVWGTGGVVVFPFGRIPVEQVLVTFSRDNPYEPQIIVSGEGRVMGYDIRMEASGPATEPRLLFTSNPPLTSQQVFMMLSTGAVPDENNSIGVSDRANRLAMFLGRNLAAGLGLGGDGGDERLSIRSGEDFSREGRETVRVQYDLDGRWSVVGEYDRFDAYNGGLKFRIISR